MSCLNFFLYFQKDLKFVIGKCFNRLNGKRENHRKSKFECGRNSFDSSFKTTTLILKNSQMEKLRNDSINLKVNLELVKSVNDFEAMT